MVHGVLGGDDEEGIRQPVGAAVQRHLPFHHGLEHGALGLGADAVQLIQEEHLAEDGAGLEPEGLVLGVPQVDAQQV